MSGVLSSAKKKLPTSREEPADFNDQPILKKNISGDFLHLERRFLAGLFENSNHCIRPIAKKSSSSEIAYRPSSLNLATISLSLIFDGEKPTSSHYEFVDNAPYKHLTYSDRMSISDFEDLVIGSIEHAVQKLASTEGYVEGSPNLIVVNEFGFPFFRQDERREAFSKKISQIANQKNAHILCGTSHCFRRKQNIAIYARPRSEALLEHAKYSPALSLGENLAARTNLDWNYYRSELGQIGVLVCFDAIDPNILLRQIYFSRDVPADNRINIYLIPSFSPNDTVRDQAEMLSFLTNSIVIYVNYQYLLEYDEDSLPALEKVWGKSHGVFVCGEDVTINEKLDRGTFKDFFHSTSSEIFSSPNTDNTVWSSITTRRVDYARLLKFQRRLPSRLSPLLAEIISLAQPDPTFKARDPE